MQRDIVKAFVAGLVGFALGCAIIHAASGQSLAVTRPSIDMDIATLGKVGHVATPTARQTPLFGMASSREGQVPSYSKVAQNVEQDIAQAEGGAALRGPVAARRAVLAGTMAIASGLTFGGQALASPAQSVLNPLEKVVPRGKYGECADKMNAIFKAKLDSGELGISLPQITRLCVHDAITYDPATKTGGFDGSIRFPEELKRPENVGLAPVVSKLEAVQKEIQEQTRIKISFADTAAFAWQNIAGLDFKTQMCPKVTGDCEQPYSMFGVIPKSLKLGRTDASGPAPEGRVPWTGSSVDDFKKAFKQIGADSRTLVTLADGLFENEATGTEFLSQDSDLAGFLKDAALSKKTTTSTNYNINFLRGIETMVNDHAIFTQPADL